MNAAATRQATTQAELPPPAPQEGLKRSLLITTIATQLVAATIFLSYRVVAENFSDVGFFEYSLARRATGPVCLLAMLGVPTSLTREVARRRAVHELDEIRRVLFSAAVPVLGIGLFTVAIAATVPDVVATLLFGDAKLAHLALPTTLYAFGMALTYLWIAFWKGQEKFEIVGALSLGLTGLVPLACLFLPGADMALVFSAAGGLLSLTALIGIARTLRGGRGTLLQLWSGPQAAAHLRFGLSRLPGSIGFSILLLMPGWWATRGGDLSGGGAAAFAVTMLNLVSTALSPVSVVMLPRAASLTRTGKGADMRSLLWLQIGGIIVGGFIASVIAFEFAALAVRWWLGMESTAIETALAYTAVGIVPFALFLALQGSLDGLSRIPVSSVNVVAALIVVAVVLQTGSAAPEVLALQALVIGLAVLAVGTVGAALWLVREAAPTATAEATR
ncbi:MAG: hypothetical protein P8R42_29525 [Candidatus Binatia bacterium]|nr:hypothetical protein [Candidatus Binatia bacterium]